MNIQISKEFNTEVLIIGGGPAGVCAAICAARQGVKTLLVEQGGFCGGMATRGLVGPFMTCYDAEGKEMIIRGIFEEIVDRMVERGFAIHPSEVMGGTAFTSWIKVGHDHVTPFEAEGLKLVLDEMLDEADVKVLYHTSFLQPVIEDSTIKGAYASSKAGIQLINAKVVIDCTGDGDVAARSGVPFEMGKSTFKTIEHNCDFCVVGGGLAGTIAALSAARHGAKVVLIQDRPMLGGNCSSEIRMWVRGAKGAFNRETGILAEFEEENIHRNPTLAPTLWDSVLFGKINENENITLLLNASCLDAECIDGEIKSVTAWQLTTYSYHKVEAKYFADCSGDSILAPLVGAEHRIGREAKSEYNEQIGPDVADNKTMGMSILLQARETDHKVEFIPPEWANVYETDEDFAIIPYLEGQHSTFRDHKIGTSGCNLWWMELGGDGEPIANTEETRDELMKVVFGIWDHIKNKGDHGCENWELEWVGFLPGKRESVRYVGEHVLTQNDIESGGQFDDVVAYGGWPMDDHNPKGMKANKKGDDPSKMIPAPSPYGIPYRCLFSKNIKNLFFAGRNISATHGAMSSTRVMATCSLLGQAMGTAAAMCVENNIPPKELKGAYIAALQQQLLDDGVFLPEIRREISTLTKSAKMNICDEDKAILQSGLERPRAEGDKNHIELEKGASLEFAFDKEEYINELRIQFDLDFERMSVSPNKKMRWFAQKLNQGLDFEPVKTAATIVKKFSVVADDKVVFETDNNYHSLVKIPLRRNAKNITVKFSQTHGAEKVNIFACDFI